MKKMTMLKLAAAALLATGLGITLPRGAQAQALDIPLRTWTLLHDGTGAGTTAPSPRGFNATTWDTVNHVAVYHGGFSNDGDPGGVNSTALWAFDPLARTWSRWWDDGGVVAPVAGGGSIPRRRHPYGNLDFSPDRQSILMYGGVWHPGSEGAQRDTWEFGVVTKSWTQRFPAQNPGSRYESEMVYHPTAKRFVIFGGLYENYWETWTYDPTTVTWVRRSPSSRPTAVVNHVMVFDSRRNRIVLFGGSSSFGPGGSQNEIWSYDLDADRWARIDVPGTKPSPRRRHGFAYDSLNDVFLVYGGYGNDDESLTDTWIYNPNTNAWALQLSPQHPSQNSVNWNLVYSPEYNVSLMFLSNGGAVQAWAYRYAGPGSPDAIRPLPPTGLLAR